MSDISNPIERFLGSNTRGNGKFANKTEAEQHEMAVAIALDLIRQDVGASSARSGSSLGHHLDNLEEYVGKIKSALE
ncbi:hypothetical protein JL49_09060 [Pseudoalteromonas luteoviolacea]|nr:hypothetical protein JL49_09060 [Pseudoalteromonas luteoviolacea]